ncbi:MAG: hypothetical protein WC488_05395, partial [Candidatus Micrarchaeia archaeon]
MANDRIPERNRAHPLNAGLRPRKFENWKKWKERWDEECSRKDPLVDVLVGLLHCIPSVPAQQNESVPFLLEIADGHWSASNFSQEEGVWAGLCGEFRQRIAEKAWAVLCDSYFKGRDGTGERYLERDAVDNEATFRKLLWFFSWSGGNCPFSSQDSTKGSRADVARKFIERFVAEAWSRGNMDLSGGDDKYNASTRLCFDARPCLVEMLVQINSTRTLIEFFDRGIDEQSMKALKRNALLPRVSSLTEPPHSVAEAYFNSRHFAYREPTETFILLTELQAEREHHEATARARRAVERGERLAEEIRDAEQKVVEAQQRVAELVKQRSGK